MLSPFASDCIYFLLICSNKRSKNHAQADAEIQYARQLQHKFKINLLSESSTIDQVWRRASARINASHILSWPATSGGERGSCVPGNLCSATIKQMHFFIVYMHCNSATTTDCNCGTSGSGDIGLQVRQAQRTNVHRPVCEIELLESLLPHRLSDDSTAARLPGLRVGALDVDRSQHADAIRSTTQHDTD